MVAMLCDLPVSQRDLLQVDQLADWRRAAGDATSTMKAPKNRCSSS
jgi:hypothetical protein